MNHLHEVSEEDSRSKREHILDAAYEVFSRKGYHRATIDEIIALADTGKGTVYNYFVNKEQLFYTLFRERSASFESALIEVAQSDLAPLAKVESVIGLFLRFLVKYADLWRVMMHDMRGFGEGQSNLTEAQREKYRAWFAQNIGIIEKVLQEGIQYGVIRPCDVPKAAYGLFSVIATLVFQKMVGDDIDASTKTIADIFLYGIANTK